jgi:acyl-CoA synthetase (AMP-forming)/AMP-acid ligase II
MMADEVPRLFDLFTRAMREDPAGRAFTFLGPRLEESVYTFERLGNTVEDLARLLAHLGLDGSRPFGILVSSQERQVLLYLAAMSAGLTPAILTPPHRKLNRTHYLETTRTIFDQVTFSAVVSDVAKLHCAATLVDAVSLVPVRAACCRRTNEPSSSTAGACFLQFSSGTTGMKRGVLVSDDAAVAQIRTYGDAIALTHCDCIVGWLPLYHDMGLMTGLNMALSRGVHSVMIEPIDWVADPALYLRAVTRYRGTLGWHPNFAYAFMADRIRDRDIVGVTLDSLRGAANCSEPVTRASQDRFARRFHTLGLREDVFWGCYAMAETTFALTHGCCTDAGYYDTSGPSGFPARSAADAFVSVGQPLDGVALRVTDASGRALPDRTVGELWVQSPFNLAGYYNNPAATAGMSHDGWYKTGDIGYRARGEYFVCGRKKDLFIIGGVNIVPHDLEDAVAAVEGIHPGRVSVFAEFDATTQSERATILAEASPGTGDEHGLVIRIRQRIAAQFQITSFAVVLVPAGWLVKSSSGKMARQANREKWSASQL